MLNRHPRGVRDQTSTQDPNPTRIRSRLQPEFAQRAQSGCTMTAMPTPWSSGSGVVVETAELDTDKHICMLTYLRRLTESDVAHLIRSRARRRSRPFLW
jgi:hypothetical protein